MRGKCVWNTDGFLWKRGERSCLFSNPCEQRGEGFRKACRAFRVENQKQTAVEFVNAENQVSRYACDCFGNPLETTSGDLQNVSYFINEQADAPVFGSDHHVHGKLALGTFRQFQPPPEINGGDDLAPQVDEPLNHRWCDRHPGHLLIPYHFLHFENIDPEKKRPCKKMSQTVYWMS